MKKCSDIQWSNSLQALRAIAFASIFLFHAEGVGFAFMASLGVSTFFVLSGFLMISNYYGKDVKASAKENILFAAKKILKLYPLHIITMLCAIPISIGIMIRDGITIRSIFELLFKIILNVTLLQTWYPDSEINASLNGVAWCLSVMLFLYFAFPYILKWLKSRNNNCILLLISILIIMIQMTLCACAILADWPERSRGAYFWLIYHFPVFRLGDFLAGCCLGCFYYQKELHMNMVWGTFVEIAAFFGTVFAWVVFERDHTSLIAIAGCNPTSMFIPIAVIWVFLFAMKSGLITSALSNRIFVYIGNVSAYTFLIHQVVIRYCNQIFAFFKLELTNGMKIMVTGSEFVFTIIIAMLYVKIAQLLRR